MRDQTNGAWIPWDIAEQLPRISLRPPSRCQVFLVVLMVWCRFGRKTAKLSIKDISQSTGLAVRTVSNALAGLFKLGILRRVGRYEHLDVDVDALRRMAGLSEKSAAKESPNGEMVGHANIRAPPTGKHVCTSPTSTYVLVSKKSNGDRKSTFTVRQKSVIGDVFKEVSGLLGNPATDLKLQPDVAIRLGLPADVTYGTAMAAIEATGDRQLAGKYTGVVLSLRHDPRVQGTELPRERLPTAL